jgi:hypothetical protein
MISIFFNFTSRIPLPLCSHFLFDQRNPGYYVEKEINPDRSLDLEYKAVFLPNARDAHGTYLEGYVSFVRDSPYLPHPTLLV